MPRGTNSATTWIPPHFAAWHQSHTHEVLLLCLGFRFDLGLVFWQVLGFRKPKSPELQALCSFKSCQAVYKTATTWLPAHLLAWQQTYAHVAFTAQPRVRVMFRVRAVPRIRVLPRIRFHKTTKPRVQSMLQIQNACQREQKYALNISLPLTSLRPSLLLLPVRVKATPRIQVQKTTKPMHSAATKAMTRRTQCHNMAHSAFFCLASVSSPWGFYCSV